MDIFKTIRPAIVNVLKNNVHSLSHVYDSDRGSFEGFPAATVTPSDNDADFSETGGTNKYDITFIVRVHQEIPQSGQKSADAILDEVVDEIITVFNDSHILGGACEWSKPAPSSWGYQSDRPSGPTRTADIKIRCRKYIGN